MTKYQFTKDMNEISGFGGQYEECCRRMLVAALLWFDAHPNADPQFGRFGQEENAEAKALSAEVLKAADEMRYGPSGAQHGAALSHALWIRKNGWDAYVREKTHPEGEVGILRERLAKAEESEERWQKRFFEQEEKLHHRGDIIATKVLGWRKYKVSNGQQEAFAPSQDAALNNLGPGSSLHQLVDDAIEAMVAA
jgi:hypothetical protein